MSDQQDDLARTMLTLACIAYRGVDLVAPEQIKRPRLRALMDQCMARFSAVKGTWEIIWGPTTFNAASLGLDDALMYVAREIEDPSTLAIAIRGTNPVSLSDWLFGDLMVAHQVPWPYTGTVPTNGFMISASTAFGLRVLQHMRWNESPPVASAPTVSVPPLTNLESRAARDSLEGWAHSVRNRLTTQASGVGEKLVALVKDWKLRQFDPLALFRPNVTNTNVENGSSLKELLRLHIANHRKSNIYVTGHSKAGALSSTLALWLVDTQGPQTEAYEEWDRTRQAQVECYSFAGPTAGNDTFSRHSNNVLQGHCHRIWNELDIVPHAFITEELLGMSGLYALAGIDKTIIDDITTMVAGAVRSLDYRQICGPGTRLDCELVPSLTLPLQIIHQHLDGYLAKFGLLSEMNAASLLAPTF